MNEKGFIMKTVGHILIVGLLFCGGCGKSYWVKDGYTEDEFRRDCAECEYQATAGSYTPVGAGETGVGAGIQEALQYNKLMKLCMQAKGYRLVKQK